MVEREEQLTRSMEDYLEAIYNLQVRSQVARVKDVARAMDVKMPSVTGAIRALASKGLVRHRPYENIELTDHGLHHARGIAHRHSAVREFSVGTLGLAEDDAEAEACGIEHAIRPATLDKLLKFVDFARDCGGDHPLRLDDFKHYLQHGVYPDGITRLPSQGASLQRSESARASRPTITSTKLSDVQPGTRGRIAFVSGKGVVRKRLMEMGVTSNANFEVLRVAPLGDPVEIKLRGYCLSLRKSEAEHIEVEVFGADVRSTEAQLC